MRTASSTVSCAAGVWANAAVVTSKRVNRVRIAVLDARGTDLVAGPRGSAPLNLPCKHPIRSSEVAGTLRAYRRLYGSNPRWAPCGSVPGSLRVVSEARKAMRLPEHGVFARFRYNDLKEAARDLRRTRALCKFNGGKERRRAVPRLCRRARHVTVGARKLAVAKKDGEKRGQRSWQRRSVPRQGTEVRSGSKHAKDSNGREWLHAAAVTTGGERSWISAAVSLSTIIIGPPHLGQDQRSLGPAVEAFCWVCGVPPSSWKESGKVVARLRLARMPKLRMRTKPSGSRCNRKRRKNSSRDRVINFCSLLWAESRQRNVTFPSASEISRWLEMATRWV